jgi:hypothetical protein
MIEFLTVRNSKEVQDKINIVKSWSDEEYSEFVNKQLSEANRNYTESKLSLFKIMNKD